ncbi:MAG: glycosyltransferase family 39 protein [Candidatus Hydrogenedentota bacterium]
MMDSGAVKKVLESPTLSEKQGLTQWFARQTRVCPARFSRLRCGDRLFQHMHTPSFSLGRWLSRGDRDTPAVARWERVLVLAAMTIALGLATTHLSAPSLWHDELVHVFVAKNITQTLEPRLPSGVFYANAYAYNYLLAPFVAFLGDGEFAVRLPAALFGVLNVLLTYLVVRKLLGRSTALVAAFMLAVFPWSVAWSREARFYTLQQTFYLVLLWFAWRMVNAERPKATIGNAALGVLAFAGGMLTSVHSVLFLTPVMGYTAIRAVAARRFSSRWVVFCLGAFAIGVAAVGLYYASAMPVDRTTVLDNAGLGGETVTSGDHVRSTRLYYFHWLNYNLSTGFLIIGLVGSVVLLAREGHRGLFVFLGFWGPFVVLSCLIGYRRARFLFFAYPLLVAAQAYALVEGVRFLKTWRKSWMRAVAAVLILVFGVRLAWSAVKLVGDSIEVARGADITLARHHPPWRGPCEYVREHIDNETVVITTTGLPVLYYVGRVDAWFPSRIMWWEADEIGLEGLKNTEELAAFMARHPKGYFIEHIRRLSMWERQLADEIAFVEKHMRVIDEVSEPYVRVHAWGL